MDQDNLSNDIRILKNSIEEIRTKLNNSISVNELLVPDTLQLSQKLDELIIQYYTAS